MSHFFKLRMLVKIGYPVITDISPKNKKRDNTDVSAYIFNRPAQTAFNVC